MFLTRRSRLALLVSLGPTLTTADPGLDASAGAPGATAPGLASGTPSRALPLAGAGPPTTPLLVLRAEPPPPQPESNRAVRAPAAIIVRRGTADRAREGDSRWVNVIFMADLQRTIGVRTVFPLERRAVPFVPRPVVSIRSRGPLADPPPRRSGHLVRMRA